MISWKDVSLEGLRRKEDVRQKELAEQKSAGGDKMLLRMQKRAEAEAAAKKAAQAQKAAGSQKAAESQSPPAEAKPSEEKVLAPGENGTADKEGEKTTDEAPAPAPVKISFGLKPKTLPTNKPGLGTMKSQSIFKRARTGDNDEKSGKKVKL